MAMLLNLLLFCAFVDGATAWGARFESLKGGCGGRTALRAGADDGEHTNNENTPQSSAVSYTLHYENRYDVIDGERFQSRLFISEPFILDASMFGVVNPYDDTPPQTSPEASTELQVDEFAGCGEDCLECAIPEEYKEIGRDSPIDVMEFLGLRRAKPISVNHFAAADGDWQ